MKIADLYAEVGFKFDTLKLKDMVRSIGNLNLASVLGTTSLAGLGKVLKDITEQTAETSKTLLTLSKTTGLDTDYIQKFSTFSEMMGASKEEAQGFLSTLSQIKFRIAQGLGGEQPFVIAGINPFGTMEETIAKINERLKDDTFLRKWSGQFAKGAKDIEQMRAAFITFLGQGLGASANMLKPLSADMEKMNKISVLTKKNIEDSAAATAQWVEAMNNLNIEFQKLATNILPFLKYGSKVLTSLTETVNKHKVIQKIEAYSPLVNIGKLLEIIEKRKELDANKTLDGSKNIKTQNNNFTVNVTTSSPEDFAKKFEAIMRKSLANADLQFGQQT